MQFSILLQVCGAQRRKHAQKSGYPTWCLYCDIPVTFNLGKDTPLSRIHTGQMWWAVRAIAILSLPECPLTLFCFDNILPFGGDWMGGILHPFSMGPSGHLYTHSRSSVCMDLAPGDSTNPKTDPKYLGGKKCQVSKGRAWIPTQVVIYRSFTCTYNYLHSIRYYK